MPNAPNRANYFILLVDTRMQPFSWQLERMVALLPWCPVNVSGCRFKFTVECPVFWALWHQSMSAYSLNRLFPVSFGTEVGYGCANYRSKSVKFWENVGNTLWFPKRFSDWLHFISFWRYSIKLGSEIVENHPKVVSFSWKGTLWTQNFGLANANMAHFLTRGKVWVSCKTIAK